MLISDQGTLVRTRVGEVSVVGRNTQGVRLIRTADDEKVVGLQRIDELPEDEVQSESLGAEEAHSEGEVSEATNKDNSGQTD